MPRPMLHNHPRPPAPPVPAAVLLAVAAAATTALLAVIAAPPRRPGHHTAARRAPSPATSAPAAHERPHRGPRRPRGRSGHVLRRLRDRGRLQDHRQRASPWSPSSSTRARTRSARSRSTSATPRSCGSAPASAPTARAPRGGDGRATGAATAARRGPQHGTAREPPHRTHRPFIRRTRTSCYVAAMGHLWGPNEERGLYRSADGGETWQPILQVDENTGVVDVAPRPGRPRHRLRRHLPAPAPSLGLPRRRPPAAPSTGAPTAATAGTASPAPASPAASPRGSLGRIGISIHRSGPPDRLRQRRAGLLATNASTAYTERRAGIYRSEDRGEDVGAHERLESPPHVREPDPRRPERRPAAST